MADTERSVSIERVENSRYQATNVRGGKLSIGSGKDDDFTPVELLLAAIGACSAIDVDVVTSRRAEPDEFTIAVRGDKIRDDAGNRMENLSVAYTVRFPDGPEGDAAREALPRAAKMSHERLCTVSRTVEIATPVTITVNP